jgi:hypothetical protein
MNARSKWYNIAIVTKEDPLTQRVLMAGRKQENGKIVISCVDVYMCS